MAQRIPVAVASPTADRSSLPAERPKVSIITPTWNRATLLRETIDSILGQDFQDFEYLIIDDGSTDDTAALVRSYGDRVTYHWHANIGEAASTNLGWRLARGDYVAVVSSGRPGAARMARKRCRLPR